MTLLQRWPELIVNGSWNRETKFALQVQTRSRLMVMGCVLIVDPFVFVAVDAHVLKGISWRAYHACP